MVVLRYNLSKIKGGTVAHSTEHKLSKKLFVNLVSNSDVPDSLSGSGSGRILPFLSDIRIRPDPNLKKSRDPGPAGS